MAKDTPRDARIRRHKRVRKKIVGTAERPRLSVFRSLNHIYAQVIDDRSGRTLVAASDLESPLQAQRDGLTKTQMARLVGRTLGERAQAIGVQRVVFDRGGFKYHGRVKALAEAAREAGLEF